MTEGQLNLRPGAKVSLLPNDDLFVTSAYSIISQTNTKRRGAETQRRRGASAEAQSAERTIRWGGGIGVNTEVNTYPSKIHIVVLLTILLFSKRCLFVP